MNHNMINKNQVTISLGVSKYWLSLVHIEENGYESKELALVEYTPSSHFMSCQCVPLNRWFDSAWLDSECVIDLINAKKLRYHLLDNAEEGQIIAEAIGRAMSFVNSINFEEE